MNDIASRLQHGQENAAGLVSPIQPCGCTDNDVERVKCFHRLVAANERALQRPLRDVTSHKTA